MKSLRLWVGPVASEKTTRALYAAKRLMRQGHDLVLVRPGSSARDHEEDHPGFLVTKGEGGERWPCIEVESALDIEQAVEGATVVWLDEPFMFTEQKKLYAIVKRILRQADVLISTITATSEMEPISPSVSALLAIADEIHPCRADCDDCQRLSVGTRSWHLGGPKKEKVKKGGEESYEPKCPDCWSTRLNAAKAPLEQLAEVAGPRKTTNRPIARPPQRSAYPAEEKVKRLWRRRNS